MARSLTVRGPPKGLLLAGERCVGARRKVLNLSPKSSESLQNPLVLRHVDRTRFWPVYPGYAPRHAPSRGTPDRLKQQGPSASGGPLDRAGTGAHEAGIDAKGLGQCRG